MSFLDLQAFNKAMQDAYDREQRGLSAWLPPPQSKYADNSEGIFGVDRTPVSFWTRGTWTKWDAMAYRWRRWRCWLAEKVLRVSAE